MHLPRNVFMAWLLLGFLSDTDSSQTSSREQLQLKMQMSSPRFQPSIVRYLVHLLRTLWNCLRFFRASLSAASSWHLWSVESLLRDRSQMAFLTSLSLEKESTERPSLRIGPLYQSGHLRFEETEQKLQCPLGCSLKLNICHFNYILLVKVCRNVSQDVG